MRRMRSVFFGGVMIVLLAGTASTTEPVNGQLEGSDPAQPLSRIVNEPPRDFPDVRIAGDPNISEQSKSVAFHPSDPRHLLAAMWRGNPRNDCVTRASADGGRTWGAPVKLPVPGGHVCSHPVVAYAPGGNRAYAAYARSSSDSCFSQGCANDILLSTSDNRGKTWSAPVIAVKGSGNDPFIRPPALATPFSKTDDKHVYLLASLSYGAVGHFSQIVFTRSSDRGRTWSKPRALASFDYMTGGALEYSVAGGLQGELLIAWDYVHYTGIERIVIQRSGNFGQTFDSPVVAAEEVDRTTHDPDLKIGSGGVAYIVYTTYDPGTAHSSIRYIYSNRAPYKTWAAPLTLTLPGRLFYAPAIAVERCGRANLLHVTWLDDRTNVLYARRIASPGYGWSETIRVSNPSSPVADQPALNGLAAAGGNAFAIWTDRRPIIDPENYQTNVYGSRVRSGVDCDNNVAR